MYLAAPQLVPLFLGDQWTQAVPFIQLFSLSVVTGFLTPLNIDLAKILGFASVYTRYAACRSVATVMAVYIASAHSTTHIIVTWVVAGIAFNLINDIVFYRSQSVVRPTRGKVAIVFAAWVWAAFAMSQILS
jgi:O-antigen/teichoic acid export membrane protein